VNHEIVPLAASHNCADFSCGKQQQDRYLIKFALRNQELGYGRTYVAVQRSGARSIDGFYTVSMSSILFANLPDGLRFPDMPKYPMPAAHMGCLAVRSSCQGQGLGGLLLIDALRKMISASEVVAARAVELIAADEKVAKWYASYGFLPFKDSPVHLYMAFDTAKQIVAETGP
jgi:ribosomal protein S18 acetylase RimI-like enzyme